MLTTRRVMKWRGWLWLYDERWWIDEKDSCTWMATPTKLWNDEGTTTTNDGHVKITILFAGSLPRWTQLIHLRIRNEWQKVNETKWHRHNTNKSYGQTSTQMNETHSEKSKKWMEKCISDRNIDIAWTESGCNFIWLTLVAHECQINAWMIVSRSLKWAQSLWRHLVRLTMWWQWLTTTGCVRMMHRHLYISYHRLKLEVGSRKEETHTHTHASEKNKHIYMSDTDEVNTQLLWVCLCDCCWYCCVSGDSVAHLGPVDFGTVSVCNAYKWLKVSVLVEFLDNFFERNRPMWTSENRWKLIEIATTLTKHKFRTSAQNR